MKTKYASIIYKDGDYTIITSNWDKGDNILFKSWDKLYCQIQSVLLRNINIQRQIHVMEN